MEYTLNMNLDRMTFNDCKELIQLIAGRLALSEKVKVITRKRLNSGTFTVTRVPDHIKPKNGCMVIKSWKYIKPRIKLAQHLWTGKYRVKHRLLKNDRTRPAQTVIIANNDSLRRLYITLHECAHMVIWAKNRQAWETQPSHGPAFRKALIVLLREFGYNPTFKDIVNGYVTGLTNMNDSTWTSMDLDYTVVEDE